MASCVNCIRSEIEQIISRIEFVFLLWKCLSYVRANGNKKNIKAGINNWQNKGYLSLQPININKY